MKLALYNDFQLGVIKGEMIIPAGVAVAGLEAHNPQEMMTMLITRWDEIGPEIARVTAAGEGIALDSVTFQPPLPRPGQLVCMAVNYLEPRQPERAAFNAFLKSNTAVVGQGAAVELPPAEASVFHFEPELALVIGKRASRLSEAEALDHVFGYVQFIDGSARGLPGGFFLGKSWHTFAPMGPALVTADEIANPNDLRMKLWVNDTLKHDFSTGEMARHVPELLVELSNVLTLEPGDVVATGTHHEALSPIQDGDTVRFSIEGLGPALHIQIHDPLKRTW